MGDSPKYVCHSSLNRTVNVYIEEQEVKCMKNIFVVYLSTLVRRSNCFNMNSCVEFDSLFSLHLFLITQTVYIQINTKGEIERDI
jgi:hypothetical protein